MEDCPEQMHDTGDAPHRTGDPTSLSPRVTDGQSAMTSCLIRAGVVRLFSRSPTSSKFLFVKESKRQRDQSVPVGFIKNLLNNKKIKYVKLQGNFKLPFSSTVKARLFN